jgi:SAM-dependent methyltransferase
MITTLDVIHPDPEELAGEGNEAHPMREVTRQVAFEPGGWTPERAVKVAALFDGLAPEWHTRLSPGRMISLTDALERGGVDEVVAAVAASAASARTAAARPLVVELGSGTGFGTPLLVERYGRVVAMDLALEMLRHADTGAGPAAPRVQADAARLPLLDGAVAALVLVNMLLFPAEVERIVAPRGVVVWVNSLGERTPIHLPAEDVASALPGHWDGVASRAAGGTWCVLRRAI